jgi:serine/threonine protein kinase
VVKKGVFKTNTPAFKSLAPEAQNFIVSLMAKNESKRLTASQAIEHSWIIKNAINEVKPIYLK